MWQQVLSHFIILAVRVANAAVIVSPVINRCKI